MNLKHKVEGLPGRLYADMAHLLPQLTIGQKQLLCLARVLLKPDPKILIIEETMDNVDPRWVFTHTVTSFHSVRAVIQSHSN